MHMKMDVPGSEHVRMLFSHANIDNDHKHKSVLRNFMMWPLIVLCPSHKIKSKLVSSELYLVVVYDLGHEKVLNNLCDM